jgi:hypothetical protein
MRRSLNLLLLDWQNRGYNLWMLANTTTYTQTASAVVTLEQNCVDVIEVLVDTVPAQTLLDGAVDDVTTTLVVDTAFANTVAFVIRIGDEEMNVTAGFGTTTLTVTRGYNGTTATAHADNAPVFAPVVSNMSIPLQRYSVPDYAALPNKTTAGRPSTMLVRREASPVTLTLWPVPDRVYAISYWYLRRVQDAGNGGNEPDVPIRFVPALIAGLAYYMAQKIPEAAMNLPTLQTQYEEALFNAQNDDREKAPLRMVPRVGRIR